MAYEANNRQTAFRNLYSYDAFGTQAPQVHRQGTRHRVRHGLFSLLRATTQG